MTRINIKIMMYAVLLCGGGILSSCASGNQPRLERQAIPPELTAMYWQFEQVREGESAPRQATASGVLLQRYRLNIQGGRAHISGGCNSYSAVLQPIAANSLSLGPLAGTQKACEKALMQADAEVTGLLARISHFRLEQNRLVLTGAGNMLVLRGNLTDESRYGQVAQRQFIELRTPPDGLVWRKATYDSDWIQNNKNAPWSRVPFPGIRDFIPESNRHYIVRVNTFKDPQTGREVWVKDMVVTRGEL